MNLLTLIYLKKTMTFDPVSLGKVVLRSNSGIPKIRESIRHIILMKLYTKSYYGKSNHQRTIKTGQ